MNDNVYFSIVIPVFQKEQFLPKCLDSILNQQYPNYEVILVDDGSMDNSGVLCDKYAQAYSNITVYHKNNTGVSDTRNFGIDKAHYKYIAFIDADDFWEDGFLSEIAYLIKKYPNCGMFSTNFKKVGNEHTLLNDSGIEGECIIENYFKHSLKYCIVNSSNVVIKRDLLIRVGGFPVGMIDAEDLCTWVKIASLTGCAFSNKYLSNYNISAEGWKTRRMRKDKDGYSFTQLLNGEYYNKEYLSKLAYKKAIHYLIDGYKVEADSQIAPFLNSKLFRISMLKYRIFRHIPTKYIYKIILIDASITRRINKCFNMNII